MKMMLSMPRTISSAVSVASATQAFGSAIQSNMKVSIKRALALPTWLATAHSASIDFDRCPSGFEHRPAMGGPGAVDTAEDHQ